MNGTTIRPALPGEAAALSELALRSKAHWGYDAEFIERCREELSFSPDEVERRRSVVAQAHGRITGLVTLEGEPPVGAVGMMFVDPPFIGRGVGGALLRHATATARELGLTRLTIDSDPHAEPFYLAMGAVRIGSVPSGSVPGRVLPLLALDLVVSAGS